MTETSKGYLVTDVKGYAYDKDGKPVETTISNEDLTGFMEYINDNPVTSVILEDFKDNNRFEVDLCGMATLEDGSKKELSYAYNVNGVPHCISLTIYVHPEDRERLVNLMEHNTWKLPAKFNPNESPSIFF